MKKEKILITIIVLSLLNLSILQFVVAGSYQKFDTIPCMDHNDHQYIPIPRFDQIVVGDYNSSLVNDASFVPGGAPVFIPLLIGYLTTIPNVLLNIPFTYLMNLLLFGKFQRTQTVHLEVLNEPEWAVITFRNANISFEIDNEIQFVYTDLIITCLENAPSTGYLLEIELEAPALRMLESDKRSISIGFQPEYVPCLNIDGDFNVITPPLKRTNITINITNCGNGNARVDSYILDYPSNWAVVIYPELILTVDETKQIIFTVYPTKDFSGYEIIQLKFTAERYPFYIGTKTETYVIQISVHYP